MTPDQPPPEQPEASATPLSNKERAAALWCRENWHAGFKIAGSDTGYAAFWAFCAGYECQLAAVRCELESALADKARLDWLDEEALCPGRFLPVAAIVVKVGYDRNSSKWANCVGSARQAIDVAMTASATRKAETT